MNQKIFKKIIMIIIAIIIVICILILSFMLTSAIIYGICWALKLTFTLRLSFGIWLILLLLNGIFNKNILTIKK